MTIDTVRAIKEGSEMKIARKVIIPVLTIVMILSLTGCIKKAIDSEIFMDILEDEFDFTVVKEDSADGDASVYDGC